MKKKGTQLLSLLLSAVMVLALVPPLTRTAKAEDMIVNEDNLTSLEEAAAWNFSTDQPESSKERETLGENPLGGTDDTIGVLGSVPLEIFIAGGSASYDNSSRDYDEGDLSDVYWYDNLKTSEDGYLESTAEGFAGVTGVTPSGSKNVLPSATVSADLNGDGIDELLRYYVEIKNGSGTVVNDLDSFNSGKSGYTASFKLQAINTQTGKQIASVTLGTFSNTANDSFFIPDSIYYYSSYMQITAGDYNGDGKDEVAVAVPDQNHQNSSSHLGNVSVYSLSGSTLINNFNKSVTYYSRYGDSDSNINFSSFCLTSGDSDNDAKDELLFTEMNDVINVDEENSLYIIDYSSGSYTSALDHISLLGNGSSFGNAGITVGDIDNDGLNEIVYGGYMVNSDHKTDSAEFSYDNGTKKTITYYHELAMNYMKYNNDQHYYGYSDKGFTVLREEDKTAITCVDEGSTKYVDNSGRKLSNAHRYPNSQNWTLPIQAVSLTGFVNGNANDQIFFGNMMYYYNASIGRFDVYDDSNEATTDTIAYNSFDTPYSSITALMPGSYLSADSNYAPSDGREQLLVAYAKRDNDQAHNAFEYSLLYESAGGTAMDVQKQRNRLAKTSGGSVNSYDYYPTVCALNSDDDATFTQYLGYEFTYTKPEVLTVMASVPYFQDIYGAYHNGPGATYITNTNGSTATDSVSASISLGWYMSFSQDIGVFGVKLASVEMEESITASTSYEYSKTVEKESSISYKTYGGQDSVVMTASPVDTYFYRYFSEDDKYAKSYPDAVRSDPSTWGTMTVCLPGSPQTIVYSVDDYNKLAETYGLDKVDSTFWTHTLGDPGTYPSSPKDFIGAKNLQYAGSPASTTHGTGSVLTEFKTTTTEENAYSFSLSLATKFGAGVGGLITGATFECETGYSGATAKYKGTTFGAELENYPDGDGYATENYSLTTQLYSYTKELNDNDVMVLDFTVSYINCLPMLPENFASSDVDSDSAVLSWNISPTVSAKLKPDHIRLERYEDYYGTWTVIEDNVSPNAGSYSYADSGLYPNTEYTYRIVAVDSTSTQENSKTLTVDTARSGDAPIITTQPKDTTSGSGETASFTVTATLPSTTPASELYYKWYCRTGSSEAWTAVTGGTNAKLTLTSLTTGMSGYQYYCTVSRLLDGVTYTTSSDYVGLKVLDHTPGRYTINFSAPINGTVSAYVVGAAKNYDLTSGDQVYEGADVIFTITPDAGYSPYYVTVNGVSDYGNIVNEISSVSEDVTLKAYFTPAVYSFKYGVQSGTGTVSAYYGSGNALASGERNNVAAGLPITLTATPGTLNGVQQYVKGWWINGTQVTNDDGTSYLEDTLTLDTLSAETTVYVAFGMGSMYSLYVSSKVNFYLDEQAAYVNDSVISITGSDGTVYASGEDIPQGTDVTISVTPPSGSIIQSWTIYRAYSSGAAMGEATVLGNQSSYKIKYLSGNYKIQLQYYLFAYKVVRYSVDSTGGSGTLSAAVKGGVDPGTGTVANPSSVQMYSDVVFTATPGSDSVGVKGWTVNGVYTKDSSPTYTVENITANTTVKAKFETAPKGINYGVSLFAGSSKAIPASSLGTDADGDSLSVASVLSNSVPDVASAEVGTGENAGSLVITGIEDGTSTITVSVTDGNGNTCTVTVWVSVSISTQETPSGLTGAEESKSGAADGQITGLDPSRTYEYLAATDYYAGVSFESVKAGSTAITGLSTGSYLVRYAPKTGYTQSAYAIVSVPLHTPSVTALLSGLSYSADGRSAVAVSGFNSATLNYYITLDGSTENGTALSISGTADSGTVDTSLASGTLENGACTLKLTVAAEADGISRTYTVNFSTPKKSSEAKLLEFKVPVNDITAVGQIDEADKSVAITLPYGADLSALTPAFTVSNGAAVTVSGTPQTSGETESDFTIPVAYTVTAEDGTTAQYTVTAQAADSAKTYYTFALSVNSQGTDMGAVTGGGSYAEGDTVALRALPAAGYQFISWNVKSDGAQLELGVNTAETSFTMPAGDVTIEAVFAAKTAPTLASATASFEKYLSTASDLKNPDSVIFDLTNGDYTLTGIDGLEAYTADTATTDGHTLITVSNAVLQAMQAGTHSLRLLLDDGTALSAALEISDSTPTVAAVIVDPASTLLKLAINTGESVPLNASVIGLNCSGGVAWTVSYPDSFTNQLESYEKAQLSEIRVSTKNSVTKLVIDPMFYFNFSFYMTKPVTCTVTATSVDDPTKSASTKIVLFIESGSDGFEISENLPSSVSYDAGQPGPELSVGVDGTDGYVTYQWYVKETGIFGSYKSIEGATKATYTLPKTMTTGTLYYHVVATSNYPGEDAVSLTSGDVAATVNAATSAAQPDVSGVTGKTAYTQGDTVSTDDVLKVSATAIDSGTLSYAWYLKATADGESDTLVGSDASFSPPTDTAGTFIYYAVVTNSVSELTDCRAQSEPFTVTVTADSRSTAKAITEFELGDVQGSISESDHSIAVTLPYGTDVTSLTPTITVSEKAGVSPESSVAQNFTDPVTYTVTAEDGTMQDYTVTVTAAPDTRSSAKAITRFTIDSVEGTISESDHTIAVTLPYGTSVADLTPTITVDADATVSPKSGTAQDFTEPVRYTVTAENGTTQDYTVTVTIGDESTYGISLSRTTAYTFTGQTVGYDALTPLTVTVTNMGNQATGALTAALSGTNSGSFTLSKTSISSIVSGGMGSFTVVPITGLSAGTYTATVTVSGNSVTPQSFAISVTVSSASSGDDTGGGSGGGGSSSTGTSRSANIIVSTDSNITTAMQTVSATTDSNGVAAASITGEQISALLTAADEKAAADTLTAVTIQVEAGSGATGVSVTIPQAAVTTLTSGEVSLTVSSTVAAVTLDSATLAEISKQASGDITITAAAADTSALSAETKAAIGIRPVYDLKITSGSTTVSNFGGGTATVSVPYTPAIDEDVNAIVVYYINAWGELVTVPNCIYNAKTGTVTFTTTHFSTYAVGYNAVSFSDVSGSAWYANYVAYLAARGIVGGNNGAFNPNASITRAEFVAILARMSGEGLSGYTTSTFLDVSTDSWYFAAVQWANRAGITSGYNGKFNPSVTITREQMAAMLYRYAEYKGTASNTEGLSAREFSDYGRISNWAQAPIQWAMNNGILSGNTDGSFAPQSSATRAQAAKILAMLLQSM